MKYLISLFLAHQFFSPTPFKYDQNDDDDDEKSRQGDLTCIKSQHGSNKSEQ